MPIEATVRQLRSARHASGRPPTPHALQGVTKERIRDVLAELGCTGDDIVDATFALLDDETPSLFSRAPAGSKFCDGASTAHIGAHVGILQRGRQNKLDREGRDYWIKPLRELGAVNPVYLDSVNRSFIPGHPKPKSPNSAYALDREFVAILRAAQEEHDRLLTEWAQGDKIRERARLQGLAQERSVAIVQPSHRALIIACAETYAPTFLPGYSMLFADYEDGQRVSEQERSQLARAGIVLALDDPMPDLILWNPDTDTIWIIEAVTTDGEVSEHRVSQTLELVRRSNKAGAGFTTAYHSWRDAARRQAQHRNIPPATYIWIRDDPAKHFLVSEIGAQLTIRGLTRSQRDV